MTHPLGSLSSCWLLPLFWVSVVVLVSFSQGDLLGSALLWQMSEAQNCRCPGESRTLTEEQRPRDQSALPALSRLSAAGFQHAPMWPLGTGLLPGEGWVEDRYWQLV